MHDYICRQDLIELFDRWHDDLNFQIDENIGFPSTRYGYKICRTQLEDCMTAVRQFRAADVKPEVKGKWEQAGKPYNSYGFVSCSVCHNCFIEPEWIENLKWRFCPSCGATLEIGWKTDDKNLEEVNEE